MRFMITKNGAMWANQIFIFDAYNLKRTVMYFTFITSVQVITGVKCICQLSLFSVFLNTKHLESKLPYFFVSLCTQKEWIFIFIWYLILWALLESWYESMFFLFTSINLMENIWLVVNGWCWNVFLTVAKPHHKLIFHYWIKWYLTC